jgi:AcrR family transcriptional regulator
MAEPAPAGKAAAPFPRANLENPKVMQILLAAAECFSENGYQGTATKEIASRAGVSKSLLHYHFQNKEHLLFELQSFMFRSVAARTERMTIEGSPSPDTALAALEGLWDMLKGVQHFIPLFVDLWSLAEVQPSLRPMQEARMREAYDLLVLGIRQTLGPAVDRLVMPPERLAQLLLTTLPAFAVRYRTDPASTEQAFEDFKLLLDGVLVPEPDEP